MLKRAALVSLPVGGLLLLLPVAALLGQSMQAPAAGPPTAAARNDIPAAMLSLYQQAATNHCPGLGWATLAAVGKVESDHANMGALRPDGTTVEPIIGPRLDGTEDTRRIVDSDEGRLDGDTEFDRAVGPMQFIPTTWTRAGVDGDGDGIANPHDFDDAIPAAARQLCATGADDPARLRQALWSYNHSWDYVDQILELADRYTTMSAVQSDPQLIQAVLDNAKLDIYAAGRDDIAAGRIDDRLLSLLQQASQQWTLSVSSLQSGHSRCVGGGNHPGCHVSNHWHGRGLDIHRVNNEPVADTNDHARALALWLTTLDSNLRPDEVGTPWADLPPLDGYFTDAAHQDHLHFGHSTNDQKPISIMND